MKEESLIVPDISCGHCKDTIERAVGALKGVDRVAVDIDAKQVRVRWDESKLRRENIEEAIRDQGYEISL